MKELEILEVIENNEILLDFKVLSQRLAQGLI